MDAATLNKRIYAGYAKAAQRIGYMTDMYRPGSATDPLNAINKQRSFYASFNAEDMKYRKPDKYGKGTMYGVFDGQLTQVGDYLKNEQDGTCFIAAQATNLPILLVRCNRTINVYRPQQQTGIGAVGYGGDTIDNETILMQQWPASVLQGSKGDKSETNLPGDVKNAWWSILLPEYSGVRLRSDDIITDDLAHRYVVSSAELTEFGWRLTAMQAQT